MLASNHPNAFLDAIIICSYCKRKTFILVRGDVFKNRWAEKWLRRLYCLPIYRKSEGRKLMGRNENTFSESLDLLKRGYNILVFAEGECENNWVLRTLGKGTARLAFRAWADPDIPPSFQVLPLGLTYDNFDTIGKKVLFQTGRPLDKEALMGLSNPMAGFNGALRESLTRLTIQVPSDPEIVRHFHQSMAKAAPDAEASSVARTVREALNSANKLRKSEEKDSKQGSRSRFLKAVVTLPAWLAHAPLYYPLRTIARARTRGTVFYDSVFFGLLLFSYPLYCVLVTGLLIALTGSRWYLLIPIVLPVMAALLIRYYGIVRRRVAPFT